MMEELSIVVVVVVFFFVVLRVLNLASRSTVPSVVHGGSTRVRNIIDNCPILREIYSPPMLWAKQGHFQTAAFGMGIRHPPSPPRGKRVFVKLSDGATATFDVFKPLKRRPKGEQLSVCICPGIGNTSETEYVRVLVDHLQHRGLRCVVLNHLGALPEVKLTSPRIFSYGGTEELSAMISWVRQHHPSNRLVGVGLSMGANVLTKYLGEDEKHQLGFLGGVSFCQGYDMGKGLTSLQESKSSFVYLWIISRGIKTILNRHKDILFGPEAESRYNTKFAVDKILSPFSFLSQIDEEYSRIVCGSKDMEEFYRTVSCRSVLDRISIPMCFLNSLDDPLVPVASHEIPKTVARDSDNVFHVSHKFGGHLGFFEGTFYPRHLSWMDRFVADYCESLVVVEGTKNNKRAIQ